MIIDMDPVNHGGDSCFVVGKPFPMSTSGFSKLQSDSQVALSQQFPDRLIDSRMFS